MTSFIENRRLKYAVEGCFNGVWGDEANGTEDMVVVRVADFDREKAVVALGDNPTVRAIPESARNRRVLRRGDLLMEKSGGGDQQPVGNVVLFDAERQAVCSNFVARLPVAQNCESRYLAYVFRAMYSEARNIPHIKQTSGIQNIDSESYLNERAWLPERNVQHRIANFLDEKTARIDALIGEKQLLLNKLSELRSSTITEEVVIQKSGWKQTRLKYLTTEIVDTEHKTAPFYDDGQYLVVRTSNIKSGKLVLENAKYTDQAGFEEWTRRGIPNENDILFTREAPAGEACLVPAGIPLCVGQRTVLLRLDREKAFPSFVLWSLYGGLASRFIEDLSQGSTVAHFNMPDIGNIPLFTGPVEEQKEHAQALEAKLKAIDELISHADDHIDGLREYRSSLISAAVTGQLDIEVYQSSAELEAA